MHGPPQNVLPQSVYSCLTVTSGGKRWKVAAATRGHMFKVGSLLIERNRLQTILDSRSLLFHVRFCAPTFPFLG